MNSTEIKGKWKELKGKVQQKWNMLTEDDLERVSGSWTELEGILQQKYGKKKDEVRKDIRDFEASIKTKVKKS